MRRKASSASAIRVHHAVDTSPALDHRGDHGIDGAAVSDVAVTVFGGGARCLDNAEEPLVPGAERSPAEEDDVEASPALGKVDGEVLSDTPGAGDKNHRTVRHGERAVRCALAPRVPRDGPIVAKHDASLACACGSFERNRAHSGGVSHEHKLSAEPRVLGLRGECRAEQAFERTLGAVFWNHQLHEHVSRAVAQFALQVCKEGAGGLGI